MIEKLIKSKRAEGYVDMCVGVVAFVCILVIAINIFGFITIRTDLDRIADELLETATYSGEFSEKFWITDGELLDKYYYYDIDFGADKYYNSSLKRVQLGDRMWVKVSVTTNIKGLGVFKIPVTVSVHRSGLSERYWK